MPTQTAYAYLIVIIGTLLFVGVVEYLNGKRIVRLMAMLEEVVWNMNMGGPDDREEGNE
jgi:Flp pilus assembly protein TadB